MDRKGDMGRGGLVLLIEGMSGGIGNAVGLLTTYPLTVIKTRLQAQRKRGNGKAEDGEEDRILVGGDGAPGELYDGPIHCVQKILSEEGVGSLYSGVALKVCETYMWNSTFYAFFSALKPRLNDFCKSLGIRGPVVNIMHGMLAGMATQLILFPLVVINTTMVNKKKKRSLVPDGSNQDIEQQSLSSWIAEYFSVIRDIYGRGGIHYFWEGISAGLLLTINPGILTLIRLQLTTFLSKKRPSMRTTAMEDFWIGFISKLIASTITYPLVVARSQIVTGGKPRGEKKNSVWFLRIFLSIIRGVIFVGKTMSRVVLENGGIKGLYAGVAPHLMQAALKEAIANSIRRQSTMILLALYRGVKNRPIE